MSKKKVKERIELYSKMSVMKEVEFYNFKIYYNSPQKLWFILLEYKLLETDPETKKTTIEFHKEMECYDGKGWLNISKFNEFKDEDFEAVIKECKLSLFNTKKIKLYPKPLKRV